MELGLGRVGIGLGIRVVKSKGGGWNYGCEGLGMELWLGRVLLTLG